MECKCGNQTEVYLVDLERKADGKIAENVKADFCENCDICYVILDGGITFE